MCIVSEPVVGRRLSSSAVRLEHNNHRKSFTLVYTLDVYSWQTYRSNLSVPYCDRSRCPKDSKAFSMSSSQALNNLTHHSLVLPATRPCPILFEQGSIVSLKYVCVLMCYALVGLACFSSRFASPHGNIYNRVGLVTFWPSEGWRCNDIACLPIERAWPTVLRCLFLTVFMKRKCCRWSESPL